MDRKRTRAIAAALCALIALPVVAGALGAAHECTEDDCLICAAMRNAFAQARVFIAAGALTVCALAETAFRACCRARRDSVRTPVLARVRLND